MAKELPYFLSGFYLHGSIALNAFNAQLSDIDFIAFMSRQCTANDIESLQKIHQSIAAQYPLWRLEGSYLQGNDLVSCQSSCDRKVFGYKAFFSEINAGSGTDLFPSFHA